MSLYILFKDFILVRGYLRVERPGARPRGAARMALSRSMPDKSFVPKINAATKADTKFYDISEGTGTLGKQLKSPTLPQLFEFTPSKLFSPSAPRLPNSPFGFAGKGRSPLDPILEDFKKGTMIFYGHAGSGKTTLLKHIAQTVLDDELLSINGAELVSYIKCQDICRNTPIADEDFLFCGKGLFSGEVHDAQSFMKSYQSKCLFLVDSVEICLNEEAAQESTKTDKQGKRKPGLILRDLLSGRLFPDARVIATSRDPLLFFQFVNARFVALMGLSPKSMQEIMTDYLGARQAHTEWENLIVKSPYLASLCRTPVFLVYVLMACISDNKSPVITTISSVMIRLLECFLHSEQTRHKNIDSVLGSLKAIAYEGVERGQYLFLPSDFQRHNLSREEAGDFTSQLLKKFLRGSELAHFNHASLQEAFAALFVAEMPNNEFKTYARLRLFPDDPMSHHCGVIRIMVCGILLDPTIDTEYSSLLTESQNLKRNKQTLLERLHEILTRLPHLGDIEIISALHEAQKGVSQLIRSNVNSIKVDGMLLFPNELHVIGSVAGRCEHLDLLSITKSNLTTYAFEILHNAIRGSGVKVSRLSLSSNPDLGPEGLEHAGKLASECKARNVELNGCILHANDLLSFQRAIGQHQLEMVDLSLNSEIQTADEMTTETEACTGTYEYRASIDSVCSKNLPNKRMEFIKDQLRHQKFEELVDFPGLWKSGTRNLAVAVASLFPRVSQEIKLYGWKFCDEDIEFMKNNLIKSNQKGLQISLTRDTFISASKSSNRNKNEAFKSPRDEVRCKFQGQKIVVSWHEDTAAERYYLEILRGGTKISEHQVATTSFESESVAPSTMYEFHVWPLYCDGNRGQKYISSPVFTDPKQPVDVGATVTDEGILVSWKPAKCDNVEKYSVKILRGKQKQSTHEVFDRTSYVFAEPAAGHVYQFGVRAYNHFGRKGEMTLSNVIKVPETMETPMSKQRTNPSPKTPKSPDVVKRIEGKKSDEKGETDIKNENVIADVRTADELRQWCVQRHESKANVHFQAIQITHRPFDVSKAEFLGSMLKLSSTVGELELRDCALNGELLDCLRNTLSDVNCKVEELIVSAQWNIEGLMKPLCAIINALGAELLNLAENDMQPGNVASFLDFLSENEVKSLRGLDVSFNSNIENWEDVGKILNHHSMTIFKAMNCDLSLRDIEKLKHGFQAGKIRHLDFSYNCELDVESFDIIPSLLSPNTNSVVFSECGLTQYEIEAFDSSSPTELKVETIDVSYNEDLGPCGMEILGKFLVKRQTKSLSIAGCNIDGKLIETLSNALRHHKLTKVDISDNCSIGDDVERVAGFTTKHQVESLNISDCGLSSGQITSFKKGIGDNQLAVLNLSDSSREPDIAHIQSICDLIPTVKEELIIIYPCMKQRWLEMVQKTLDSLSTNGPKVTYGTTTESTRLLNDIKFTVVTKKKFLQKKNSSTTCTIQSC